MAVTAASGFGQNQKDAIAAIEQTKRCALSNHRLWKEGNKSKLIQIGMALVAFPEPTPITVIIGSGFIAAGAVQQGIKSQSIYMEDIPRSLNNTFREVCSVRNNLKL